MKELNFERYIKYQFVLNFSKNINFSKYEWKFKFHSFSNMKIIYPLRIKNYKISRKLGQGSFGVVCKAILIPTKKIYAVKIIPKESLMNKGDTGRFQREVNAMAFFRHENLITLYDFFSDQDNFYLIMDYCENGALFSYVLKHKKLDEPTASLIFKQIVQALQYCHNHGVAHRDLKPENIVIDKFPHILLTDFGLCGFIQTDVLQQTICGTPCYNSPECLRKTQYDGQKSDIWSLGVVLFFLVTGKIPWKTNNISQMTKQIFKRFL